MRYKGLFEQKLQQLTNQLTGIHSASSRGNMVDTRQLIENAKERIEEMQTCRSKLISNCWHGYIGLYYWREREMSLIVSYIKCQYWICTELLKYFKYIICNLWSNIIYIKLPGLHSIVSLFTGQRRLKISLSHTPTWCFSAHLWFENQTHF